MCSRSGCVAINGGADEARLFGFVAAADFAGRVEEISRSLEYLQVVAAQAVERTRKEAQQTSPGSSEFGAGPGWRTGWTEPEPGSEVAPGSEVGPVSDVGPGLDVAPVSVGEARSMSAGASVRRAGSVIGPGPVTEAGSVTGAGSGGRASDSVSLWMTGTGLPLSSFGPGCGSASVKPGAGSPSPPMSCPPRREWPGNRSRPGAKSWPTPSPQPGTVPFGDDHQHRPGHRPAIHR